MSAATRWIAAIVGLLTANLIAMAVLVGAANTGRSQVIPEYYDRAVHYNDAIDQAAKNRTLGWQVRTRWDGKVIASVTDRDGRPLQGARIDIDSRPRVAGQRIGVFDVTVTVRLAGDMFVERTTVVAR